MYASVKYLHWALLVHPVGVAVIPFGAMFTPTIGYWYYTPWVL